LFIIEQNNFSQICVILSPLIVLTVFQNLSVSTLRGFKKFKKATIITLSQIISLVIFYFIIFLDPPVNPIIALSYSNFFSYIISSALSLILIIKVIPKTNNSKKLFHLREIFKISKEFGIYLQLTSTFADNSNLAIQYFLFTPMPDNLAYYKITKNSENFLRQTSGIAATPYQSIFSELAEKNQYKKMNDLYYKIIKYNGFILCIMYAIMFFFMDLYIILIYTENYLIIIIYIQIFLLESFLLLIINNLDIMLIALNKHKAIFKRIIIFLICRLIFLYIGIYFFGYIGYVIFEVISTYLYVIISYLFINTKSSKLLEIKLKLLPILKTFFLFIVSLLISLLFHSIILNLIDFQIVFVSEIVSRVIKDSIGLIICLTVFYIMLYVTKTFTKEEIADLFNRDIFSRNLKGLNKKLSKILIKFFPSEKKDG